MNWSLSHQRMFVVAKDYGGQARKKNYSSIKTSKDHVQHDHPLSLSYSLTQPKLSLINENKTKSRKRKCVSLFIQKKLRTYSKPICLCPIGSNRNLHTNFHFDLHENKVNLFNCDFLQWFVKYWNWKKKNGNWNKNTNIPNMYNCRILVAMMFHHLWWWSHWYDNLWHNRMIQRLPFVVPLLEANRYRSRDGIWGRNTKYDFNKHTSNI